MDKIKLCLIDATAFCYRAYYALGNLTASSGQPTNAVYGFVTMLNRLLKEQKPDMVGACFDVSRDTFRARKFADYKIQRPAMPDGLASQLPLIRQVLGAYGISIMQREGFEADDVIASIARKVKTKGWQTLIVTSDKDMFQLIDSVTKVYNPFKGKGTLYGEDEIKELFGVTPVQTADIIALAGDTADNIPGAKGIGEKTALNLVKEFGSVENLLAGIDDVKSESVRKILKENSLAVRLSKELVLLEQGLDFDLEELKVKEQDTDELRRIFSALEFRKLLSGLPVKDEGLKALALELSDPEVRERIASLGEIAVYPGEGANILAKAKDQVVSFKFSGPAGRLALESESLKKVGHDLKNFLLYCGEGNIAVGGLQFDTMVAAYLLNPAKGDYCLASVAWDYAGEAVAHDVRGCLAVDLIAKLKPRMEGLLKEISVDSLFYSVEMPLVEVLGDMEVSGIKLDTVLLSDLSRDLEKRLIVLMQEIYQLSGTQFNINSPQQLRQVLFERLKLPVGRKSKTGPSTDEEVLRVLSRQHRLPALLLEYRQLMKLKTTYVDPLPGMVRAASGRLHTSFNQTATETGRLSSSHPNLQNIPVKTDIGRLIRKAIISSSDKHLLLSSDYSQIELRVLAHLSKDQILTSAFLQDRDIHKATAALIYGVAEADVSAQMRDAAKRINFGIVYGLSPYGLSRDLEIPQEEAREFIEAYFSRYPQVKDYIERQLSKAREDGFVTTIMGRRRYLPEINSKNQGMRQFAERQAINTPIQGSASDLIKLAMVSIHSYLKRKKLGTKMLLQIHDELVFDVPLEEIEEVSQEVRQRMQDVYALDVPVKVDIKQGRNWLEMEEV